MSEKAGNFSNPNYQPYSERNRVDVAIPSIDAAERLHGHLKQLEIDREEAIKSGFEDSLTKCYNRNFFDKFRHENVNPDRDHNKLALIFVDLNGLKAVNDDPLLGYAEGDRLLQTAANFLKSKIFRADDFVARVGGDEFVIICRHDKGDANFERELTNRASEAFSNAPIDFAFGVAVYDKDVDEGPTLDDSERGLENTKNRAGFIMHNQKARMKGDNTDNSKLCS